jgi:hypothetical protein
MVWVSVLLGKSEIKSNTIADNVAEAHRRSEAETECRRVVGSYILLRG